MQRDEQQSLAVAIGLLLLVGGVLVGDALVGPWPTLTVGIALVLIHYLGPAVARELIIRRFARQIRRHW
ncbi:MULTISPECIES: hypothetical protein [Streptomyces]|uniref:Uncharacterized protein n=1 Tax=Streptomyces griseocarneus TaxID=51201 RepID=A0ABX7RMF2_9ACTN|nr:MULTISPECIES: hypothetical protein [Streptomyces]QSY48114.1 hypothetical protein J3S04_23335 [Streptomyces griseocarneus]